jgi:hypothetical protein
MTTIDETYTSDTVPCGAVSRAVAASIAETRTAVIEVVGSRVYPEALLSELREICDAEATENDGSLDFAGVMDDGDGESEWRVRVVFDQRMRADQ